MKKTRAKKIALKSAEKELSIPDRQEIFCRLYAFDQSCFCNATRSYMAAFDLSPNRYKSARVLGQRLLAKVNIREHIDRLLNEMMTNKMVDKEIGRMIGQNKNLVVKAEAFKEYNRLKNRIKTGPEVMVIMPSPLYGGRSKQKV